MRKGEMIELIATLRDGELKKQLIAHLLKTGEITEEEIVEAMVEDVKRNAPKYFEAVKNDKLLQFVWQRFESYPDYLARALVAVRPDLFYAYGFAFRLILELNANLGPVIIPPRRPSNSSDPSVFREDLPEMVKTSIFSLDKECRFREYLYIFSRDAKSGFEILDQDIAETKNDYERKVLVEVRNYCEKVMKMKFPDFVEEINGSPFPSFHVRWWIDKTAEIKKVLNIGDTGSQKTAFAIIAVHHHGCRKVLVLCPANARQHWEREVKSYFKNPQNRVFLMRSQKDLPKALQSNAQFTVVAYSTLIQPYVIDSLKEVPFDGLIWDECHYGKSLNACGQAQRAIACAMLLKAMPLKKLIALSATPFENHPSELAAVVTALKPEVFPSPEIFSQNRPENPRFLREFLSTNVVEVELREIKDLPPIHPQPWCDLFGAELIEMNKVQSEIYYYVRENDEDLLPAQKVERLLLATTHPHGLKEKYEWPKNLQREFFNWEISTKLVWLKSRIQQKLAEGAKVVVGSGIFAEGITRSKNSGDEEIWVGKLLQRWFGENRVIIIDGSVSPTINKNGRSKRGLLINRWRTDPEARILLVSIRACPDSVNLTVPALPGVKKLFVTALSYPWVPWKQFLGRFWREGQGVPVEYRVPILRGTIDESLLQLVKRKWRIQQLFRAQVPLTEEERRYLDKKISIRKLAEEARSDLQKVNIIGSLVQGRGEEGAKKKLEDAYGTSTNAEIYARAYLAIQEYAASSHISRFMAKVIKGFEKENLLNAQGILDAGCGPLTLERRLNRPVYGIDLNPFMIELARPLSLHRGKNARVGYISKMPDEWSGKFDLVVASLVLDWTSVRIRFRNLPERLWILKKLVSVTHPHGRIWLTFTEDQLDQTTFSNWIKGLQKNGFLIIEPLTGLVRAVDSNSPFAFWSICFSPNGYLFTSQNVRDFYFIFETERVRKIRGGSEERKEHEKRKVIHEKFEILAVTGEVFKDEEVVIQATDQEAKRLAQLPWRVLQELEKRGILVF